MKFIQLTQGKYAIVDDEDFDRVNQFKWSAQKIGKVWYAVRGQWNPERKNNDKIFMHCFILSVKGVDHWDGNGLNNQKENLRPATKSQNAANAPKYKGTSRFKGVSYDKDRDKWFCCIGFLGTAIYLGRYESDIDAAISYNHAALAFFGEFAKLNDV